MTDDDRHEVDGEPGFLIEMLWQHVAAQGLEGPTLHSRRPMAAGLMISVDAHPRVIRQRLGHSSITTTMNGYGSILQMVDDGVTRARRSFRRRTWCRWGAGARQAIMADLAAYPLTW